VIDKKLTVETAKPVKILVVDDDSFTCQYFKQLLTPNGFQVEIDNTGFGLARLSQEGYRPDMILLDLVLGPLSGVELSRHLKTNPFTRTIPLVAMSASGSQLSDHPGLMADAYLTKPFEVQELLTLVDQFVSIDAYSFAN
jgi:CheY-like chemotaxis protein